MKKLLLVAAASLVLFASCDKEPKQEPEEPSLIGAWHTTRQDLSVTVDGVYPPSFAETIKQEVEQTESVEVSEAGSYKLAFNEDGTGSGSGVRHDGEGRFDFYFEWQLSVEAPPWWREDSYSFDDVWLSIEDPDPAGYGAVFLSHDHGSYERVSWKIEEFTADKLVLRHIEIREVDAFDIGSFWNEIHSYRYTFEKMK